MDLIDDTTNIILSNYDLQLYALPQFITTLTKLENITFTDYNFDTNKIKFDESFEIIKTLLENKNIKINGCDFNIFLGDYYGNNNDKVKAMEYYKIIHKTYINAASKMVEYYCQYSDRPMTYSQNVHELLNKLDKKFYNTIYFVSLKYMELPELPKCVTEMLC